ncbi:MAG TPA: hypothetical protein VFW92_01175, partial [Candidatus Limnocylindrales bacterium]|nr:hypothetical protein [Candidatus Limnocylindrales bacterium]
YASPALIGAVGLLRRSQGAVAAAGLICLPLAFTSFGLVTLPLLIPMALFFIGAARLPAPRWAWLETPVLTAAAIAAWFVLLIPRETISYTLPGGGFGSSEEPTLVGAAVALALTAAAGIVAWLWPRSPAPEPTLAPW